MIQPPQLLSTPSGSTTLTGKKKIKRYGSWLSWPSLLLPKRLLAILLSSQVKALTAPYKPTLAVFKVGNGIEKQKMVGEEKEGCSKLRELA